eukprot:Gregarina_sp_Poly_1__8673@NODE_516_length_7810_cov_96_902622_g410_i0_p8_GENE_NODE_516_length_7810_cov_96_902622_g410_i0NODE_516_length_7810_cov_96_902622_g410_i0_p8_ORF_typecomplete_len117_score10_83_NODE_516_length_7810_cov_96_902622_g410_i019482298
MTPCQPEMLDWRQQYLGMEVGWLNCRAVTPTHCGMTHMAPCAVPDNYVASGIPQTTLPQLDHSQFYDPQPSNWTAVSSFDQLVTLPSQQIGGRPDPEKKRRGRDVNPAYEPPAGRR